MDDLEYIDMYNEYEPEVTVESEESEEAEEISVKCILLKNGTYIISKIEEVVADFGMPNCRLINPKEILNEIPRLVSWPRYTSQTEVMTSSENFLTICDPDAKMLEQYMKLSD